MSDSISNELIRKRSRSSSPDSTSSGIIKKANTESTGPSTLSNQVEIKEEIKEESISNEVKAEDVKEIAPMETDEASNTEAAMLVDQESHELPTNPSLNQETSTTEIDPAAAAVEVAPVTMQMRALIVTQDAAIIIGKGGKNVNEIREKSGAKITISEAVPGNPERVMVIAGALDAVSKAFGLVVRRINDEPFADPSLPGSRAVTIRFIIPNSKMGSVIGKAGSKIKEIQEASGARLQAGDSMLPGSTERVLSVSGVADAIHIAVYYIGTILQESTGNNNNTSYRPAGGNNNYANQYGDQQRDNRPRQSNYSSGGGSQAPPPGSETQQIFIPNELVGSIIGKGGAKINEIRSMSGCQIKICEPGDGSPGANASERLVTITGQQGGIQTAVSLLYQRLESEKQKQLGQQ